MDRKHAGDAVTYENTTKDLAAAVMAADSQGLRILYYSLADDTRKIGIVPWELESGGTYNLKLGIDRNDDDRTDAVVLERSFVFPQPGSRPLAEEGNTDAEAVDQS